MDYLNPIKERRHRIILFTGYICIAIAIAFAGLLLRYEAYGYGLGKGGTVIQNGLVFFSSHPNPATINISGMTEKPKTNTRLVLPEGIYHIAIQRAGYRTWQRTIEVDGGSVEHFDYPLLVPSKLTTKTVLPFTAIPGIETQSPDRRWIVLQQPGSMTDFEVFDTSNPTKAPVTFTVPATTLSKATSSESWQFDQWADDNQHILMTHIYDGKSEFIELDRTDGDAAVNLNTLFNESPTKVTLNNLKYDQFYLYGADSHVLQTASLKSPTPQTVLEHVLAYQSYGDNTILYATDADAPTDKVLVRLQVGTDNYLLHTFASGTTYLLDLTTYDGILYVAAGAASENKVYIYKDPIGQLQNVAEPIAVPAQVLHVFGPNYISFSDTAQFIMTESGTQFAVYDIQNMQGYSYTVSEPLDSPQMHATWMDGDRLVYVSGGNLQMIDYDNTNHQTLVSTDPDYIPAFSQDYNVLYSVTALANGSGATLDATPLLTAADQ